MVTPEAPPARYCLASGKETTATDPHRIVWYSATGCMWTDDWNKLDTRLGIPACGAVGMMATAVDWFAGAQQFERDGHPRYEEFVRAVSGRCVHPVPWLAAYAEWRDS